MEFSKMNGRGFVGQLVKARLVRSLYHDQNTGETIEEHYEDRRLGFIIDLHEYIELLLPQLLQRASVSAETITTINDVSESHVPASLASPVAAIMYELLSNSMKYAFSAGSLANYISVTFKFDTSKSCHSLIVSDSGSGLARGVSPLTASSPGFSAVRAICSSLGATLEHDDRDGTSITVTIPRPQDK